MHGGTVDGPQRGPGPGQRVRRPAARCRRPRRPGGAGAAAAAGVRARRDAAAASWWWTTTWTRPTAWPRLLTRLWARRSRVAHDGPTALAAAAEFRPEVVLLDIGLPGMDGYEVARRLRRRPEFEGTLLVALTGWGQEEDRAAVERGRLRPPPGQAGRRHRAVRADVRAARPLTPTAPAPPRLHALDGDRRHPRPSGPRAASTVGLFCSHGRAPRAGNSPRHSRLLAGSAACCRSARRRRGAGAGRSAGRRRGRFPRPAFRSALRHRRGAGPRQPQDGEVNHHRRGDGPRPRAGGLGRCVRPARRALRYRLLALGYFLDVRLSVTRGASRGGVVLVVEVEERGTIVINELFPSTSAATAFWGGADVSETNFLGRGINLGGGFVGSTTPVVAGAHAGRALRLRAAVPPIGGPYGLACRPPASTTTAASSIAWLGAADDANPPTTSRRAVKRAGGVLGRRQGFSPPPACRPRLSRGGADRRAAASPRPRAGPSIS